MAIAVVVERRLVQAAVSGAAAGLQIVAIDPDVLAGLSIRSVGNSGLVAGLKASCIVAAVQRSVVVHNVISAAAIVSQLGCLPFSICILAICVQDFVPHTNVL